MQPITTCDVAICGGGLGGLALAAGLHRRGYDVRLFEAASNLRTATGTLIGLGINALTALEALHPDIVPRLKEKACKTQAVSRVLRVNKTAEPQMTTQPPPGELYTMRWSMVQNVLAGLVPPEVVHCGCYATGYTEDAQGGPVRLHFKDKPDVLARLAVGADGLRSAIRATMVPNDPGPRYLGHMNWNALIHNPQGSVVDAHEPAGLQVHINQPGWSGERQWTLMTYVIDAGCDYTFWQVRLESEQPSFTPAPGADDNGTADPGSMHSKPYLVGGGLGKPGSKARVEQMLEDAGFDRVLKVVQATPESSIFERAMLDRVPLDQLGATLGSAGGRVLLLGDAAHAMHSGPGQGARMAFEDAHTLALQLDQHRGELQGWTAIPRPEAIDGNMACAVGDNEPVPLIAAKIGTVGLAAGLEQQTVSKAADSDTCADKAALTRVVSGYNDLRLPRVCRVQRAAAEGCGVQSIRQALRPEGLTDEERRARNTEMSRWLSQYPANPTGDPESVYWKPAVDDKLSAGPEVA